MYIVVIVDDSSIKLIGLFEYFLLLYDKSFSIKNICELYV